MKLQAVLIIFALMLAPRARAAETIPSRDTLAGFNGVAFGSTFAAVKKQLGAAAKPGTDPGDAKIKILLAKAELYGETFATNYTFASKGRLSAVYAVAALPTGDQGVCQTRWVSVMAGVEGEWGKPDANFNQLSAKIPTQTITYSFDDGAVLEAGIMGCLLTLNYLSPFEAK